MTRVTLATANTPGAVAIVQLHGEGVAEVLQQLTGRESFIARRAYLCSFADIDEGLAIVDRGGQAFLPVDRRSRMSDSDQAVGLLTDRNTCPPSSFAQLMPHGGPRVVQRLLEHLTTTLGCVYHATPDPQTLYSEANSPIEADLLDAIAKATSPAAIDLLTQQPTLWRSLLQQAGGPSTTQRQHIANRSRTLNHLVTPPTVVVAGPANVGKSTLTNALMGKAMSIVADLPGTTRDWVGGLVELSAINDAQQAIAVHFLDTPGLRDSDDAIEQRAIQLAKQQIEQADVLIAMRDPGHPWPDSATLPREPDLYVVNKVDDAQTPDTNAGLSPEQPLSISATHNINLDCLQSRIIKQLGLSELINEPWAFTDKLLAWCQSGDDQSLAGYLDPFTRRVGS